MWKWDQGRLEYFQFDELRKIAKFAMNQDLRQADHDQLKLATGLEFSPNRPGYKPWRNYGRTIQLALISVATGNDTSQITELGRLLARDGQTTADEYFHFLAQATTDPSPALASTAWDAKTKHRYPLLFALRFLLARVIQGESFTNIDQIIFTYQSSNFIGNESQSEFQKIIFGEGQLQNRIRQASESIKVLAQISYLTSTGSQISVSLSPDDAKTLFERLSPVGGLHLANPSEEILRICSAYPSEISKLNFDYPSTIISNTQEAGFSEGGRVKRTHITLERNSRLRDAFFLEYPSAVCDFCQVDTKETYPWTTKVLDIHHLLPLCSGSRTNAQGTVLKDLVANCPTCHRAVHRFYDYWLRENSRADFKDAQEARAIYTLAKSEFSGVK